MLDSGVGGLTVARAVLNQLPGEQILYIGDTANTPYGPKTIDEVRSLALGIMDELVEAGVKMLVIACNTASAAVLHDARRRYTLERGVPVVEVIHSAARAAARVTRNGRIGLIATQGTVDSRAYADALEAVPGVELFSEACPRFVDLAERGVTTGPEALTTAEEYLAPVKSAGVDTLILGCTHYPLLIGPISYVMGEDVTLVTSSEETAKDVYRELARTSRSSRPSGASCCAIPVPPRRITSSVRPEIPNRSSCWRAASWAPRSDTSHGRPRRSKGRACTAVLKPPPLPPVPPAIMFLPWTPQN